MSATCSSISGGYRFAWMAWPVAEEQFITPLAYVGDGDRYLYVVNSILEKI